MKKGAKTMISDSEKQFSWDDIEFHKTFPPQDTYITKILDIAARNFSGSKEEISSLTGIPTGKVSGKVIPHIRYAALMGLISYVKMGSTFSLELTDLGKMVYQEDKFLYEKLTRLICHYNLSDPVNGAVIWQFLYTQIPFSMDTEISRSLINQRMKEYFGKEVKLSVIKSTYSEGFMEPLGILSIDESLTFSRCFYNREFEYAYAYLLLKSWESTFPQSQELSIDQISNEIIWGQRFGFDESETISALEEMAIDGIVKVNKQLHPYTVVRLESSASVLPKLYSKLL